MRVSDETLHCVVFVCRRRRGAFHAVGTAFLIGVSDGPSDPISVTYLVTARHVIEEARRGDDGVYLRMNTTSGGVDYFRATDEWWFAEDPGADIAVGPMIVDPRVDAMALHVSLLATNEALWHYEVGIGDELSVVGLFTSVLGNQRNRPIVRSGVIAAMPDEAIIEPDTPPYYAYLAELRSTGGLSGSPVAVMLGYDRNAEGLRERKGPSFIIGVIRGHWPAPSTGAISVLSDDHGQVNRGIATVTPIQHVAAILSEPAAQEYHRREREAIIAERQLAPAPSDGSAAP